MTFWDRLQLLMKEKHVTAKQLSEELSINKNSFTYWKRNGNIPKGSVLSALSEYFDCSIDYLLGKTDIKKEQTATEQPVSEDMQKLIEIASCLSPEQLNALLVLVDKLIDGQS